VWIWNVSLTPVPLPFRLVVGWCSDWGIKVFDVLEEKDVKGDGVPLDVADDGRPLSVHWAPDGQILSVTTRLGNGLRDQIHIFGIREPVQT
jgi:hypothetical protein